MADEDQILPDAERRRIGGIPLRAFAPNAITILALCSGLTGVRFAIGGEWAVAVTMIIVAGVLDGMDGRIAACCARRANSVRNSIRCPT